MPLPVILQKVNPPIQRNTVPEITNTIAQSNAISFIEHQQKLQPSISNKNLEKQTPMDQLESKHIVDKSKSALSVNVLKQQIEQTIPEMLSKEDLNKNVTDVEDLNKTKKISWASNYLQSIGHNNVKPIKINLSIRNKIQRTESIATKCNNSTSSMATHPLLKDTPLQDFNMADNPLSQVNLNLTQSSEFNKNVIVEHINGNIKTSHPGDGNACRLNTNKTSDAHGNIAPTSSRCDNITSTTFNSASMRKQINSNNKALEEEKYCYNDVNHSIDILDAIKATINRELPMERKSRAMNLPSHKEMCEDFIKGISSNNPTTSDRKDHRSKSSKATKKKEIVGKIQKKYATSKSYTKNKNLVTKEKIKDSLIKIKNNVSDKKFIKEQTKKPKHVSLELEKGVKIGQDKLHYKKPQIMKIKPISMEIDKPKEGEKSGQDNLQCKKQQVIKPKTVSMEIDKPKEGKKSVQDNLQYTKQQVIKPKTVSMEIDKPKEDNISGLDNRHYKKQQSKKPKHVSMELEKEGERSGQDKLQYKKQQVIKPKTISMEIDKPKEGKKSGQDNLQCKKQQVIKQKTAFMEIDKQNEENKSGLDNLHYKKQQTKKHKQVSMELAKEETISGQDNLHYKKHQIMKPKLVTIEKDKQKEEKKSAQDNLHNKQIRKPKHVSMEIDKPKEETKSGQDNLQYKKQQIKKPIVDLNDFVFRETEKPKTIQTSPERQKLKRVRTNSDDLLNPSCEIRTHSPIKSVVLVAENSYSSSPKRQCLEENFDLRSKLSRVNQRIFKKQMKNDLNKKTKQRENFKITVENQTEEKMKSPKKSSILKYKRKKLKLIINVVCQGSDDETSTSDSSCSEAESNQTHNMDLSFLDDINVDEIVDSLKHSPKHKIKSPLPHDSKSEDCTKMLVEPELKLATIINMLQAKCDTTKTKTITEFKIEETIMKDSSTRSIIDNPSLFTEIKKSMNKEENENKLHPIKETNTTHALVQILSKTNMKLQQQNTTAKCDIQTKDFYLGLINPEHESQSEGDRLMIDESVIITEPEVTIIDLTDEAEYVAPKTNHISTSTTLDYIESKKQGNENTQVDIQIEEVKKSGNDSGTPQIDANENQFEPILSTLINENNECGTTAHGIIADVGHNNESPIKLTNDTVVDKIESNISTTETVTIANTSHNIQTQSTNNNFSTVHIKIVDNDITNEDLQKSNNIIENKKEPREVVENVLETCKESVKATKKPTLNNSKDISKALQREAAINIINKIIENVWETKNEHENVPTTNKDTKTKTDNTPKCNNTKPESENTSQTNVIGKKVQNESAVVGKYKALATLLEERMLGYLHKEIKIIKHIRQGRYSNIFSCKDPSGQMYAAKVLTNENNRQTLGIQKEQMIKQIQQDIPKENLNTIYLIDGFGVERYWCFLTEYYPVNLQQVLNQQKKPFHIDRVQHLARQLISAVMVLRNNEIVHSDIRPTHILLNSSHNRLKLCGFDGAYYINNVNLLPNIGTMNYRAPEIIIGFSAGYSIDVWSSALVIYQMTTNQKLFNCIYNNEILFKQMCIFGDLPRDMVEVSLFQNKHFQGRHFMKRVGSNGQDAILYQKFYKTKRLYMTMVSAYHTNWKNNNWNKRNADLDKLAALNRLLEQMLLLDPRLRHTIEFVCADPFINVLFW